MARVLRLTLMSCGALLVVASLDVSSARDASAWIAAGAALLMLAGVFLEIRRGVRGRRGPR